MRELDREMLAELKAVTNRPKLRVKDILEWSTSEWKVQQGLRDGEVMVRLPKLSVYVAIPAE